MKTQKSIIIDGCRIVYETKGTGSNALLFIHGGRSTKRVWHHQMDKMDVPCKLIAVDLPGYGSSGEPKTGYAIENRVNILKQICAAEGTNQVIIVAHSNGVIMAKEFYRRYGGLVKKMILIDGMQQQVNESIKNWRSNTTKGPDYVTFLKASAEKMPVAGLSAEDAAIVKEDTQNTVSNMLLEQLDALLDAGTWEPVVIDKPVLLINSKTFIGTEQYQEHLKSTLPYLRYEEWPEAGHFIQMQYPEKINEKICQFVTPVCNERYAAPLEIN